MLKKGILAVALALLFAGALAQKREVMLDKVVAVVGGSSILYSEVDDYARQLVEQRRQEGYTSDRDPMNEALEALALIGRDSAVEAGALRRLEEIAHYVTSRTH